MRKSAVLFLAGFLTLLAAKTTFAADITADSNISEVTVYPRSALIGRVAQLDLAVGSHAVLFPDIIPEIDENSLRVSAKGSALVKLFGAKLEKEFLEEVPGEEIQGLKDEIERLEDEARKQKDLKAVLRDEKNYLDSIKLYARDKLPEDLITKMPTAEELGGTLKFLDEKLKENYSSVMDTDLKVRELSKKIEAIRRKLSEISGYNRKLKRSIVADLEVLKPGKIELKISYLVRGASWQPIYDARAEFDKSEVEFVSYGIVTQKTGEDWEGVDMSLSTAKPAIGGRMPYVKPWVLKPYVPRTYDKRDRKMKLANAQVFNYEVMQEEAFDDLKAPSGAPAEPEYSKAEEKGTAVVYKLAKKVQVKSDGSEHKLPISSQILKADFKYSAYPRAVLHAYLGSRVTNAAGLQLLAGRINIFLEGDFVGTSGINTIGPGEEFDLYLGVDENVKIKREQIEKKVDETLIGGIRSSTKRIFFKYKLTVENYKSKAIKTKLFEAMPVPEDDRIKVKIKDVSLEPDKKDWKDRKGIWLWELDLKPKEKKEIFYTYTIEHPREMRVAGL